MNDKYWIEKSNTLNTLSDIEKGMNLIEFRFFCLYLSKINARDLNTRHVEISIEEFEKIFSVKLNTTQFNRQIRKIMGRTVEIIVDQHREILTLYSRFRYKIDNPKFIEISCNDMMLPYLFELKKNYTTYTLNNIVELNSVSKIRLYEICKQYEKLKEIKFPVEELKRLMCVDIATFKDFKFKRLDPAIRDINEYTDITVSYEKILSCRRVIALKLNISRKDNYLDIAPEPTEVETNAYHTFSDVCGENPFGTLYLKCNKEYTLEQLFNLSDYVSNAQIHMNISTENYIYSIYRKIKIEGKPVKNLYKYTFAIIEKQITEHIFSDTASKSTVKQKKRETSYDLEEFKNLVEVHEAK